MFIFTFTSRAEAVEFCRACDRNGTRWVRNEYVHRNGRRRFVIIVQ